MYREAYAETDQMKRIVHKIVPTYHLREADIIRDQQIQAGWNKEFTDTRSKLPSAFLSRSAADLEVQEEENDTGNQEIRKEGK